MFLVSACDWISGRENFSGAFIMILPALPAGIQFALKPATALSTAMRSVPAFHAN
ncbi:hypothetical protein [Herminiimonas sp. CN]|uniref:hypothetical protein n=1 Tax=Herminiimonas sp. CN TaxID=1349818 RepID=UPI0012DF9781|nr:hypothetical protein [Herminiimonas sp. CN]